LVQKALVDGGRLGRKVGKGFYAGPPTPPAPIEPVSAALPALSLVGRGPLVEALSAWLTHRGLSFSRGESADWVGLVLGEVHLHLSDGRTAAQIAHERRHAELAVMDWPVAPDRVDGLAVAFGPRCSPEAREAVRQLWHALGWELLDLRDVPGLAVARTVAMLVNEGSDAVWQGVCDEQGADLAMKLGVNYPAGPFEWLALLGAERVVELLDALFAAYRSERYRVSPLLQQRRWA